MHGFQGAQEGASTSDPLSVIGVCISLPPPPPPRPQSFLFLLSKYGLFMSVFFFGKYGHVSGRHFLLRE